MCSNRISIRLKRFALVVIYSVGTTAAVSAQTKDPSSSVEATLVPGSTVWITDFTGHKEKTRITGVSGGVVTGAAGEQTRRFRTTDIMRIEARHNDSVLNGALIGAGSGIALGLFYCTRMEPWDVCRRNVGAMAKIAALGAGIGIGVDALIRGRRTIYEAPRQSTQLRVAPILDRGARGVQVSVGF